MKFFSIDIETTGLDWDTCQILCIGAVFVDTAFPDNIYNQENRFLQLIKHEMIHGEPYALNMNAALIAMIAKGEGISLSQTISHLDAWMKALIPGEKTFIPAGKNFAGFDARFLKLNTNVRLKPAFRTLDPGPIYSRASDTKPPDLETCCERAGVPFSKALAHDALYDAERVALCMLDHFSRNP